MNRRTFLAASAAAAVTGLRASRAKAQTPSPNAKLCHACIGVGGMGYGDFNNFKSHAGLQIVAICDVDKGPLGKAAALLPGLLLARVDGKSPVEYVTEERQREAVRRVAGALLKQPVASLRLVRAAWARELER